jgi:hypothetical protein
LNHLPANAPASFTQRKANSLSEPGFDPQQAKRLYDLTEELLKRVKR